MSGNLWLRSKVFKDSELNTAFRRDGYVILEGFLNQKGINKLVSFYESNPPEINSGFHTSIHSSNPELRRAVTEQVKFLFDPLLEQHMNDYRSVFSAYTVKEPDCNSEFDLHLDWSMVDERLHTSVTCWVPLIDITEDNGYLWVLHASHLFHYTIRGGPGLNLWCETPPAEWHENYELRKLKLKKGDALIYDHRLFHGSPANTSKFKRLAINHTLIPSHAASLHYQFEGDAKVVAIEVPDDFYHSHILNTKPSSGNVFSESIIEGGFVFQHDVNELAV